MGKSILFSIVAFLVFQTASAVVDDSDVAKQDTVFPKALRCKGHYPDITEVTADFVPGSENRKLTNLYFWTYSSGKATLHGSTKESIGTVGRVSTGAASYENRSFPLDGQKLWCNKGSSGSPAGSAAWLALDASAQHPDVLLEEGAFAVEWGNSAVQFYPEANWKSQVDTVAALKNSKVGLTSHTKLAPGQSGTDNWSNSVTYWQVLWYSLSSMLLAKNDLLGNAYFEFGDTYNGIPWFDEYDRINLGSALGPYSVTTISGVNVYGREFANGYVYVNPTPNKVASLTLPQPCRQLTHANILLDPSTLPTVNALPLNGHDAVILLK